jgi:hypothetical protein
MLITGDRCTPAPPRHHANPTQRRHVTAPNYLSQTTTTTRGETAGKRRRRRAKRRTPHHNHHRTHHHGRRTARLQPREQLLVGRMVGGTTMGRGYERAEETRAEER